MIAFVLLFVCICSFIPTPSDESLNKNVDNLKKSFKKKD